MSASGKPNIFKQAEVIIIIKDEDKDPSLPKSYRPICLLNTLSKMHEKLLCTRLHEQRQIVRQSDMQYGYRKGKSTEDAINKNLSIVDKSTSKYVLNIFIDISGA